MCGVAIMQPPSELAPERTTIYNAVAATTMFMHIKLTINRLIDWLIVVVGY